MTLDYVLKKVPRGTFAFYSCLIAFLSLNSNLESVEVIRARKVTDAVVNTIKEKPSKRSANQETMRKRIAKSATIKHAPVNIRNGPDTKYNIIYIIEKKNTPVSLFYKIDNWCLIQDYYGHNGWVICASLSTSSKIDILKKGAMIYRLPVKKEKIAETKSNINVSLLDSCVKQWCRIGISKFTTGWVEKKNLWLEGR
jgi:SH3-like domain-containing protein